MKLRPAISFVLTIAVTIVGIAFTWYFSGIVIPAAILAIIVYGIDVEQPYKLTLPMSGISKLFIESNRISRYWNSPPRRKTQSIW
jgi:hypothetical protein